MGNKKGMTLVELIITMVLVAMVSPVVYGIIGAAAKGFSMGSFLSTHTSQLSFAFDQLEVDVTRAQGLIYASNLEVEFEIEDNQSQIRRIRYYLDGYNDASQSGSAPYTLMRADSTNGFSYDNGVPVLRGVAQTPTGAGFGLNYYNYRNTATSTLTDMAALEWWVVITEDEKPVTFAMRADFPF